MGRIIRTRLWFSGTTDRPNYSPLPALGDFSLDALAVTQKGPSMTGQRNSELDTMISEIWRMNAAIRREQLEIDALRSETREIAEHTDRVLERLNSHLDRLEASM